MVVRAKLPGLPPESFHKKISSGGAPAGGLRALAVVVMSEGSNPAFPVIIAVLELVDRVRSDYIDRKRVPVVNDSVCEEVFSLDTLCRVLA